MSKNPVIAEMKSELKELAALIRAIRNDAKTVSGDSKHQKHVCANRYGADYRPQHIAYCLLRGRTLDQIEDPQHTDRSTWEYDRMIKSAYRLRDKKEAEIAQWRASQEVQA